MADQNNIQQATIDLVTSYIANNVFKFLTTGTGNADALLTTTDVENPVSLTADDRNIPPKTITLDSGFFNLLFRVTPGMPVSLPVDLQQFGIHTGADDTTGIKFTQTWPVAFTKDGNTQVDVKVLGRTFEFERAP